MPVGQHVHETATNTHTPTHARTDARTHYRKVKMNLSVEKTDLFRYEERGLQTQNQERPAQLTEAAGCRGSSRVARHFRRHTALCRHTYSLCPNISRLSTANSSGSTRTRLNNKQIKRCQYHRYSPSWPLYSSFSSLSFIFVFTVFNFYGHFILSLCLH